MAHNENIAEKLRSTGVQVVTVAGELSDQAQVDRFLDEALSKTAHIDVVYNNAAIVQMNLLDPGWLHTDLGGPNAPNDPSSVLPGALEKALAN